MKNYDTIPDLIVIETVPQRTNMVLVCEKTVNTIEISPKKP